ncbi:MAG: hypothetical protein B6U95_07060 [Thermofilum sp. ex4484_82]|nr:MAG: hypothetical protein B6U95_07060 [Thermofilum sp. ex4484_82]OYT37278.1 MAG: hypothetical protein B6U96_07055 [Archaeoglobales archaeon ex4484_92]
MRMDECEEFFKEGEKSSFLKREYYVAALSYMRAAECFLEAKLYKRAYVAAMRSIECLEKTRSVDVSDEYERAFEAAYEAAKFLDEKKLVSIRERFLSFLVGSASNLELSKDYIGAAEKYMKAAEIADKSKRSEILVKAVRCLEQAAEMKMRAGKRESALKLLQRAKELLLKFGGDDSIKRIDQKHGALMGVPEVSLVLKVREEFYKSLGRMREEISERVDKAIDELRKMVSSVEDSAGKLLVVDGEPTLFERIRKKGKFFDKLGYAILEISARCR